MNAKIDSKFRKPEEYKDPIKDPGFVMEKAATLPEVFFRLRLMPASLVQYAVERVTVQDDHVVERKVITERDILPITLSKIEDALVAQIRR